MAQTVTNAPVALKALKIGVTTFLFLGLILVGSAGWNAHRQYRILTQWRSVDAQVTECRIVSGPHSHEDVNRHWTTTTEYWLSMNVRYTVAGRDYIGHLSTSASDDYNAVRRWEDENAPGTHQRIRYDPRDPADIGHDVGFSFFDNVAGPLFAALVGIFFLAIAGKFLALMRRVRTLICPTCGQTLVPGQASCPHCGSMVDRGDGQTAEAA